MNVHMVIRLSWLTTAVLLVAASQILAQEPTCPDHTVCTGAGVCLDGTCRQRCTNLDEFCGAPCVCQGQAGGQVCFQGVCRCCVGGSSCPGAVCDFGPRMAVCPIGESTPCGTPPNQVCCLVGGTCVDGVCTQPAKNVRVLDVEGSVTITRAAGGPATPAKFGDTLAEGDTIVLADLRSTATLSWPGGTLYVAKGGETWSGSTTIRIANQPPPREEGFLFHLRGVIASFRYTLQGAPGNLGEFSGVEAGYAIVRTEAVIDPQVAIDHTRQLSAPVATAADPPVVAFTMLDDDASQRYALGVATGRVELVNTDPALPVIVVGAGQRVEITPDGGVGPVTAVDQNGAGDVNGDGAVDEADLARLDAAIHGVSVLDANELQRADVRKKCGAATARQLQKDRAAIAKFIHKTRQGKRAKLRDRCSS